MKKTPLYTSHIKLNAKMIDFSGFNMPVNFSEGINKEVESVRNTSGIFDVSHMGFFKIKGKDFVEKSNNLFVSDIGKLKPGNAKYTVMCNHDGGIIDDLIVYMNKDSLDLIVNCSNLQKNYDWIKKNLDNSIQLNDKSESYSIIAVQGPDSRMILEKVLRTKIKLKFFNHYNINYFNSNLIVARTGYTGELGYEVVVENSLALNLWNELLNMGAKPCGLASRDVLRIEMCYSLYGNDIDINTSPIEAGLDWLIDKSNNSFIGSETMKNQKKIIYFSIKERGIPRKGHKIIYKKKEIGHVTSGTFSTTLKNGIGFGYLTTDLDTVNYGEEIEINANGRSISALIVKPPFITDTSIQD